MPGLTLKTSAAQSAGAFEVIELRGPLAPTPHIHREREELFYVLEGDFEFILGDESIKAPAGSVVFIPRGTRHAPVIGPDGRGVVFVAPAGLEGFFDALGKGLAAGLGQDEIRASLEGRFNSFPCP